MLLSQVQNPMENDIKFCNILTLENDLPLQSKLGVVNYDIHISTFFPWVKTCLNHVWHASIVPFGLIENEFNNTNNRRVIASCNGDGQLERRFYSDASSLRSLKPLRKIPWLRLYLRECVVNGFLSQT